MQQSVPKASGSGLTKLRKEEEWAAKEIHLTDDKHKVSELPKSPNCSSLIALYLQGNYELTAIPPLFFQRMALLQVLDLSRTSIKSLPKSLPKLVALKKLLLRGCDLFMELSPQVGKLKNIEELDLDETQIMDLPREIGKLLKLRQLKVSFYYIYGKKKSKSNIVIHPETISNFSQLAELSIDVNPADKRWDDSVEAVVKEVCKSKTLRTLSLYLPKFQLLDNTSLIYPSLSRFRFTVGHQKRRIISRVPHEVEAEFRNWDKCLKFVNGENIPIEIKGVLKYSTSFFLDHHATAMNLSEFGIENMKGLKFCLLAECNKMETLIDGEMHYERNEDDQSESDPGSVEHVLESLEYLSIYYMENLQSIWRGPNCFGFMSKLKFLALHTCPQLSKIFSHTLLENFVSLEEIILEDCPQVTSLVSHASVKPMMSDKIFLPSLKRLLLLYLPELVSISNGLLIAPKLESIGCYNCPKLKSISKMELSSKTLKIIKGECQWWEDMNWNEREWGNRADYLMHIFSPINNEEDLMTQLAEDRDLLEATIQNEGQQLGDEKLLEVSTQDHKGEWLGYTEERIMGTDVTESPSACILPSKPLLRASYAPEQAWSFSSEKNKSLEDDCFDLASEICEVDVDEDESKAKRWNCTKNENKGVIGSASKTTRRHRVAFRGRSDYEVIDDGFRWRKYGKKANKGSPHARNYYRCSTEGCPVKKRVERDTKEPSFLITTYKGIHNHVGPYNVEDTAEATKTISPRKGYRDVFEASLQDKDARPEYAGIPEASIRDKSQQSGGLKMESSPSKRAQATNNGTHQVSCLVDQCNADLSNCRGYYRRHKVCERHSKAAEVMIYGLKQRFCQQCSRFHSLEEFDKGKRSCRKRLDGFERRRRKPQPVPLPWCGSYFSNYQGTEMLPFSSLHVYPSTTVVKPTWPGVTNSETESRPLNQQQQLHSPEKQNLVLGSSSSNYRGGKQFTFLQGENNTLQSQTPQEASVCQPLLKAAPFSGCSGGSHSMFCYRLTTPIQDSDCALSLPSSPQAHTSGISLSNMVQPHSFPLVQPLGPSLQNRIIEPMDSVVVANGRDTTVHCPGMFHMGSGGSSGSEAPHTFPLHWQ